MVYLKTKSIATVNRLDIDISIYMEEADDVSSDGLLRVKWGMCAVSNIQSTWRGWYVRHLIKRIRAAYIIQRLWKGWNVRHLIKNTRSAPIPIV